MNNEELIKKVQDLKELKVMADELKEEITSIEDEIKAEMTLQKVNELHAGMFKIRWTPVKSNRFDTTQFKKVYTDLYNQFTRTYESMRFSIS